MVVLWATAACSVLVYVLTRVLRRLRCRGKTTPLRGPRSPSLLYGWMKELEDAPDTTPFFDRWTREYGLVYRLPMAFGTERLVVMDPKAITHICTKDTVTYRQSDDVRGFLSNLVGSTSIISVEGDEHKKLRRVLGPSFSPGVLRKSTPIFLDMAYKVKAIWDAVLEDHVDDGAILDVAMWIDRITLGNIGLAEFGDDFGALAGQSPISTAVDGLSNMNMTMVDMVQFLAGPSIPWILHIPTNYISRLSRFKSATSAVAKSLIKQCTEEIASSSESEEDDRSVLDRMMKSKPATSALSLQEDDIGIHIRLLIAAGYETTAVTLTWALIELARHPDIQRRLRGELQEKVSHKDPNYDDFNNSLPYLDAVVHEILRIHPVIELISREAVEDDVLPLSEPMVTASGKTVDRIQVSKGTLLGVQPRAVQNSPLIWGEDCKMFKPERWLDGTNDLPMSAKEVRGYRHLLTFGDGPRTCLGKGFAILETKAVLSVLVRHYWFELCDGPSTKIARYRRGLAPRPQIIGSEDMGVPMLVRRIV